MARQKNVNTKSHIKASQVFNADLSKYGYYRRTIDTARGKEILVNFLFGLFGNQALFPPIQSKQKPDKKSPRLVNYGHILGFCDEKSKTILAAIDKRVERHTNLVFLIYAIVAIIVIASLESYLHSFASPGSPKTSLPDIPLWIYAISIIFLIVIIAGLSLTMAFIGFRLGSLIADRLFADALCVMESFYIAFELQQDDVLLIPSQRRTLLARIDYLAKKVLLMSLNQSSSDSATKEWARQYFRKIERYIREREKWVIAPQTDTLQVLRRDFYNLTSVLVYGNYGEIDWDKSISPIHEKPKSSFEKIISGFLRFIAIAIPIGLMVAMILFPDIYIKLGIENRVVSLIALAWFLLAVDANLKLGVVEHIVDLAKAFKELGK